MQRGPAQVAADFRDMVRLHDGLPRVQYSLLNVMLEADDVAGTAHCRSHYIGVQGSRATWSGYIGVDPRGDEGLLIELITVGRYEDRFVRGDDGWQFASRICFPDFTGDRSAHLGEDPVEYGRRFNAQQREPH